MDGLAADDAAHRPAGRVEDDALAGQQLDVDAADGLHEDEAVVVDVLDDEADFVAVAVEHEAHRRAGVHHGVEVAVDVEPHFVGVGPDVVGEKPLSREFPAGGRRGLDEFLEEGEGFGVHGELRIKSALRAFRGLSWPCGPYKVKSALRAVKSMGTSRR